MTGQDAPAARASGPGLVQTRLRLALDAARMGLWDWDVVTGELVWDERSAALYGTTLAESTGTIADVDARVHPEDLPAVRAELAAAIEQAGAVDVEFRVVWPDGSVRWLYGRGQALVDETGAVVRVIGANINVTEVRQAARQRAADAERMGGLVRVAHALSVATTEDEVLQVVATHGTSVLDAQGAGLCLVDPDGSTVQVLTTDYFSADLRAELTRLPAHHPLPIVHAAVTGTAYFLTDRAQAEALFPGAGPVYARAGTDGSAEVPMQARGENVGALSVAFAEPHEWRDAERQLLEALASLAAQAVDRIRARRSEQDAMRIIQGWSETLQRSLLTAPPAQAGMAVAVRYQPAAQEAQVGGDWYDAFVTPDGGTTLVVGDVSGHDRDAAAAMGQVRNILRGVAQTLDAAPGAVLAALDQAMAGLQVTALATAVLCQVTPPDERGDGARVLRWSNAGHPPPLLVQPDGEAELLVRDPDLLLGLQPDTLRHDHRTLLRPGATLLLYSDGLVERRDQSLDVGLERLRAAAAGTQAMPVETLCDVLLGRLAQSAEDDVALLVLRTEPICVDGA